MSEPPRFDEDEEDGEEGGSTGRLGLENYGVRGLGV